MEKSNVLKKIKELLTFSTQEEEQQLTPEITDEPTEIFETPEEVKVEEVVEEEFKKNVVTKLVDGTEVLIVLEGETIKEGDKVMVKQGEEYTDAPDGEHKVEGGMVITTANGAITKIEEVVEEEMKEEETKTEEVFNSISLLTDVIAELKKDVVELMNNHKELNERVNSFAAAPSVESIKKQTKKFSTQTDKIDKLKFFGNK